MALTLEQVVDIAKLHPEYDEQRVSSELEYIKNNDLQKDFLDVCEAALAKGQPGSKNVLNSFVFYLIRITSCKPVDKFDVPKRRAYVRDGWPDVDIDVCYLHRSTLIAYAKSKYGEGNVATIGTVGKLEIKSAIHKAILVLDPTKSYNKENGFGRKQLERDPNFQLKQEICDSLPNIMKKEDGTRIRKIKEAYDTYPEFKRYMDKYPKIYKLALKLEGTIASYGTHAAGVILSPIPLEQICPLHLSKKKKEDARNDADASEKYEWCTQFTMTDVEAIGLPKMDFLGISTETSIARCFETVKKSYNIELDRDNIPIDTQTLELLNRGEGVGVFQAETRPMQNVMRQIGIDSFEDIIACVSIFRPGPMQYIDQYADRKHGKDEVSYLHPLYEKIASSTYAILIYQEQIMRIFVDLAQLSENDGYKFIKGCAKKNPKIVEAMLEKFIAGCAVNNISPKIAKKIADDLHQFAGYSFNLSHATGYAKKSATCSYLKAHFPAEFIEARLTVEYIRKSKSMEIYRQEAQRMGFKILKPDLNKSGIDWQIVDQKTLLEPLIVKGIGVVAAQEIIKCRPYDPNNLLVDFSKKIGLKNALHVTKREIDGMYSAGMWQGYGTREKVVETFEKAKEYGKRNRGRQIGGNLFGKQ